ncbi:MAG: helix-turn-helix domain-containing protein [Bacteroidetes bacterium]|nr:helix-turn-helix domain-containing protein [Bacteroidota bacterium]
MDIEALVTLATSGTKVSVNIELNDLIKFGDHLINKKVKDLEQVVIDDKAETYPTPKQVANILGVEPVTLWRWAKRGYLVPMEIGGKRRYKMSEVKAFLNKGRKS